MNFRPVIKPIIWSAIAVTAYESYSIRQGVVDPKRHSIGSLIFLALLVAVELALRYSGKNTPARRRLFVHVMLILLKTSFAILAACEMNREAIFMAALQNTADVQVGAFYTLKSHILGDLQQEMIGCWKSLTIMRQNPQCKVSLQKWQAVQTVDPPELSGSMSERVEIIRQLHGKIVKMKIDFICAHSIPEPPSLPEDFAFSTDKMSILELVLLVLRLSSVWLLVSLTALAILGADALLLLLDTLWEDRAPVGESPASSLVASA